MIRRVKPTILTALVLTALLPAMGARAGVTDHLICYRTMDKLRLKTAVDMIADLQPEFSRSGCLLVKPVEFCVPASKTNVNPAPPYPDLAGQTLSDDYVCYKVACPDVRLAPPPDKLVTDQFGARVERKYHPIPTVCVPARKAPVPCGPNFAAPKQCSGVCPNPGQSCMPDPLDKGCHCVPTAPAPCGFDNAGVCSGGCTFAGFQCGVDTAGNCGCFSQ